MHKRATFRVPESVTHADDELTYTRERDGLLPGHRVELLIDGSRAFPAMLAAIERATRYVHLETYILEDDDIGMTFARVLCERARAGVDVRVMYDALGSLMLAEEYPRQLREAGVKVVEFGPLGRLRGKGRWSRRDHRKILVVDGTQGFAGGINISLDYAPAELGGKDWRDTHVRVEGPLVDDLERMFREVWHTEAGEPYAPKPREAGESVAVPGSAWARAQVADFRGQRSAIRQSYLHAIARARRHIYIANAYFVPDRGIRRALTRAVARGVDVRVLLSGQSDVPLVGLAGEHTYARLLRRGVRLYLWMTSHMHSKVAVIDGVWSTVGSYNLDYVSLFNNLEVNIEIIGREFGTEMEAMFAADFGYSHELALATWRRRPWWRKLLAWIAYRIRRWL